MANAGQHLGRWPRADVAKRNSTTPRASRSTRSSGESGVASQSFTVLVELAEAIWRPSGDNAIRRDLIRVPAEGQDLLARRHVPEPHGLIIAGGGDAAAVGLKRHGLRPRPSARAERSTSWPVTASHSFTVRSRLAEAIWRPSG